MSKSNAKKVEKGGKARGTLNISPELFAKLQAFQEHVRVSEGLLFRPTYTEVIGRLWDAYQDSLTQKKAHRKLSYVGPERETTNLSDDNRVAL